MEEVYILIGNIASGKTSWLDKNLPESYSISKDNYRKEFGLLVYKNYLYDNKIEPEIDIIIKTVFKISLKLNLSPIVIDETNMKKVTREDYIKLGKEYGYKLIAVVFPSGDIEEHVERRYKENYDISITKKTWRNVFKYKQDNYEAPTYSEGFDQIICL